MAVLGYLAAFAVFYAVQLVISLFYDSRTPAIRPRPYSVWAMEQTAEFICFFCGLRIHVSGEELLPADGKFLFVSNHRSNFDPIVVMNRLRACGVAFVSKPENLRIPIVGPFIHQCCFLSIDRENARNAVKTINEAADYIKNGVVSIGIYPEGTRSKSKVMGPFHAGSFKIAQKAGAPVVVSSIRGTEQVNRRILRGTDVYLDILRIIPADEAASMKSVELSDKVRAMLEEHLKSAESAT